LIVVGLDGAPLEGTGGEPPPPWVKLLYYNKPIRSNFFTFTSKPNPNFPRYKIFNLMT